MAHVTDHCPAGHCTQSVEHTAEECDEQYHSCPESDGLSSCEAHYLFVLPLSLSKISWLTKQGFSHEYIEEVIASDALNEPQEEEIPKGASQDVDKELKAAQDAAKAAGEAAKNVFGRCNPFRDRCIENL